MLGSRRSRPREPFSVPKKFEENYKLRDSTPAAPDTFNPIFDDVDSRLALLEQQSDIEERTAAEVQAILLQRLNSVLLPAIQGVLRIQDRGFLMANSASVRTLQTGIFQDFLITDQDEIDLFVPAPILIITRQANPDDYGIAQRMVWNKSTGVLTVQVLSIHGNPGPHSDWVISSGGAILPAEQYLLDQVLAAFTSANAKAGEAAQSAADALAIKNDVFNRITVSTLPPSGGVDGSIWFKV
jgi:hypothetical protein